jgi:ribose transport system permease protein
MERQKSASLRRDLFASLSRNSTVILLYIAAALMFLVGEIVARGFLSFAHIGAILRTASFLGIVAIGQTLIILTGGIDLSVGPMITMGNVFICMFMNGQNTNNLWSLALILFLGLAFGAISGFGISFLRISPLVMTLAVGSLVTGFTLIFSQGAPKGLASPLLRKVGVGYAFGIIPNVVIIWVALCAIVITLLGKSVYGRKLYYTGANVKAANLSGIRVRSVKVFAYTIGGMCSVFSGTLMAGYTRTAFLGIGNEYTMWSITAVVIGGTSLTGGKGGYIGTIAGVLILVLLESILTVMRIPEAGRKIADGLIILIMITIYFRKGERA